MCAWCCTCLRSPAGCQKAFLHHALLSCTVLACQCTVLRQHAVMRWQLQHANRPCSVAAIHHGVQRQQGWQTQGPRAAPAAKAAARLQHELLILNSRGLQEWCQ
jgi:hypothetical protein